MSIYPMVTEQNLNILSKQQKNERAIIVKKRFLKQTHDKKLAENFSPITKNLDEVNQSTKKLGEVSKPNSEKENIQEIVPVEITPDNSKMIIILERKLFQTVLFLVILCER